MARPQAARQDHFDAIVVGTGAAGLAAAQRLAAAGVSVLIVEARDRVGGRIQSLRLPGWTVPIEAGAEFIHGQPDEIWSLVRTGNLATCEVSDSQWKAAGGRVRPHEFQQLWKSIFGRLEEASRDDLSFADFLNRHCSELTPGERAQATAYVEGFNAADSRLISSRWLLEADRASGQGGEAGAFRILSGYDGILNDFLTGIRAGRAELRLSTVVSAIRWQAGRVELDLASRAGIPLPPVHARCAVVTVPLGVLRAAPNSTGAIQFIPDLPKKWAGSSALKMGSVVKLVLRFREPFWEETALGAFGFLHAPEEPFPTWWTTNPVRTTILTGWAGGPAADRLAGLSAEAILDHALNSLGRVLSLEPARLASIGDAWHVADWQIDPFARGAYSYVGVGGQQASRCLADAVEATLFFAGEATHDVLGGTVAGALASGYRAADEVLELDRDGKERILLA